MVNSKLEESDLLLSRRLQNVWWEPFCFFYVDDYLPADFYLSLLESFPSSSRFNFNDEGKMGFRSSEDPQEVERFLANHSNWRQLFDFLGSDGFLDDVRSTLKRALTAARPWTGRKPWDNCTHRPTPNNWLRYRLREPVRTTYQFSLIPRDGTVVPHSDAPRKLVSLMLYFRDTDWKDAWGGGTEFYVPLDPRKARSWKKTDRIPFEEFKTIDTTRFVGNRLAGFVRSDVSYHGVQPLACPPGAARRSLLINIKRLRWSKRHQP